MNILQQIKEGRLRCVRTGQALRMENGALAGGHSERYAMAGDTVPILLKSSEAVKALLEENPAMVDEYRHPNLYHRLRNRFYRDYTSRHFQGVLNEFLSEGGEGKIMLAIGGGPGRHSQYTTNLNIGPFPNVDLVGDAHDLPYLDGSVDSIHCDAVLEHVREPIAVVRECWRVLKPGGRMLSVIPFMQGYHGYPNHFQNYSLSGHEYLYQSNGFNVIEAAACQGPVVALTTLNSRFCLEYLPRGLNVIIGRAVQLLGLLLRPLDRFLETHPQRHVLASSTYVLAQKPLSKPA